MPRPDIVAFDAIRRAHAEIPYDRMKTAVKVATSISVWSLAKSARDGRPTTASGCLPAMRRRTSMRTDTCPDPFFGRVDGGNEKSGTTLPTPERGIVARGAASRDLVVADALLDRLRDIAVAIRRDGPSDRSFDA